MWQVYLCGSAHPYHRPVQDVYSSTQPFQLLTVFSVLIVLFGAINLTRMINMRIHPSKYASLCVCIVYVSNSFHHTSFEHLPTFVFNVVVEVLLFFAPQDSLQQVLSERHGLTLLVAHTGYASTLEFCEPYHPFADIKDPRPDTHLCFVALGSLNVPNGCHKT